MRLAIRRRVVSRDRVMEGEPSWPTSSKRDGSLASALQTANKFPGVESTNWRANAAGLAGANTPFAAVHAPPPYARSPRGAGPGGFVKSAETGASARRPHWFDAHPVERAVDED